MLPAWSISVSQYILTYKRRRSCKQIEKQLFDTFADEFFTKRQFMVEHASLTTLVDIASHPTLSQRLVQVIISTEMFDMPSFWIGPTDHISRDYLLHTGMARDLLAEAFSKLSNLKIVGLRDYNAVGRNREGPRMQWRSYGKSHENSQEASLARRV